MKKLLFGTVFWVLLSFLPDVIQAQVNISIGFPLPPPIVFAAPPAVIALPGTYAYAVPDVNVDIFFSDGWWWRPWQGRWYRSNHYDHGWSYYDREPTFYRNVDPGWRRFYKGSNWHGKRWSYERIPVQRLHRNWQTWHNDRHWEKRGSWGVENYRPRLYREQPVYKEPRRYQQKPAVEHRQKKNNQQKSHSPSKRKYEREDRRY